jgi:hypothetical protein
MGPVEVPGAVELERHRDEDAIGLLRLGPTESGKRG